MDCSTLKSEILFTTTYTMLLTIIMKKKIEIDATSMLIAFYAVGVEKAIAKPRLKTTTIQMKCVCASIIFK